MRLKHKVGFPCGTSGKEPARQCRRRKRHRFEPWVRKIPWKRKWQPSPVFLPGESHGQRSLAGYDPQGHRESDTTEGLHAHAHESKVVQVQEQNHQIQRTSLTAERMTNKGMVAIEYGSRQAVILGKIFEQVKF